MTRRPVPGSLSRRSLVAAAGLVWAGRAVAQTPTGLPRIGSIHIAPADAAQHVALRDQLRRMGFIDGRTVSYDRDGFGLRRERFAEHAARLKQMGCDVIYAGGEPAIAAARDHAPGIPVVGLADDMVAAGFAASLSRPGGLVTGCSLLGAQMDGKRLALLAELLPQARHLACLADRLAPSPTSEAELVSAVASSGIRITVYAVAKPEEIAPAMEAAKAAGAEGLNVLASSMLFNARAISLERMRALRLPAMFQWPDTAREGGLVGYGPNMPQLYRTHMAPAVARILGGARPDSMPISQPDTYELVINRRTAEQLGVTISLALMGRADEVVE